ncbi:MAG: diaminopimelate epimerase [Planctomycetes bacterium]|nr:diaminopimelate epimerase [Planctomycetota bacterium]
MSQELNFTKMHGIGNDYVYIDTFEQDEPVVGWAELARRVSDRRFGVGGDGLILIEKPHSEGAHGRMRMFNSDGSESEMCGNGLRCVSKYLFDRRCKDAEELLIDTGAGLLSARIKEFDGKGKASQVELNMGQPILEAAAIPSTGTGMGKIEKMQVGDCELEYMAVSMGNPHCVIFVDDPQTFPVETIGPQIESNTELFPRRVNVEFVQVVSATEAVQRTWERGSGETLACGTGASAVAVAGKLWGKFSDEVLIHLSGGDLKLNWQGPGHEVIMQGGATHVCDGLLDEAFCV